MKLEVGKRYKCRNGDVILIDRSNGEGEYEFSGVDSDGDRDYWDEEGRYDVYHIRHHNYDLIAPAEPEGVTDSAVLDFLEREGQRFVRQANGNWLDRKDVRAEAYPTLRAAAAAAMGKS